MAAKPERNPMSTLTLLDEIDDLERLLAGAAAPMSVSKRPGALLAVAGDDEEEEDLFGEDDLGFDDIDEEDADEDDDDGEEDLDEDPDEEV
jgi:hypothetical protein